MSNHQKKYPFNLMEEAFGEGQHIYNRINEKTGVVCQEVLYGSKIYKWCHGDWDITETHYSDGWITRTLREEMMGETRNIGGLLRETIVQRRMEKFVEEKMNETEKEIIEMRLCRGRYPVSWLEISKKFNMGSLHSAQDMYNLAVKRIKDAENIILSPKLSEEEIEFMKGSFETAIDDECDGITVRTTDATFYTF